MQIVKNTKVDSIEALADAWLMKWSRWAKHGSGLGHPRRWVTERAREGGILAGSPRPPTTMPDDIAAIDKAVARLGYHHRSILGKALHYHYLCDNPVEWKAIKCGESISGFHTLLRRAQRRIYFYLEPMDTPLQRSNLGI